MATTPTTVPATVVAGDSIIWQQSFSDYPASVWTLKYRLLNATGKIDITAGTSGDDYLVSVSSTTSAGWVAGDYSYTAWVEKIGERVTVDNGRISISPNLATLNSYDGRSPARQIYEGLMAAYQAAVTTRAFVSEYEIAGRKMKFNGKADWLTELNYWKAQVSAEDRAAALGAGMGGARVLVRF
jgi:hypothetical protein